MIARRLAALAAVACACACVTAARAPETRSGNPILPGWYADPEARVFEGRYWIFPTYSAPYDRQTVAAAVGACMAAIEVVDDRYEDYRALDVPTLSGGVGA